MHRARIFGILRGAVFVRCDNEGQSEKKSFSFDGLLAVDGNALRAWSLCGDRVQ